MSSYGIQLHMTVKGIDEAVKKLGEIEDMMKQDTDEFALAGMHGAAKVFEENFLTEGGKVGGWAGLKEQTQMERRAKGFNGEHPILVRYGELRRLTTTELVRARRRTFRSVDSDGKSINVDISASGGNLNVVASGDKAVNQITGSNRPARPYWFVNNEVLNRAKEEVMETIRVGIQRL